MVKNDFDGVYIIPSEGVSSIEHRGDVSLNSSFHDLYPLISSPMKGVSGPKLVIEMGKNNCLGILHRFETNEKRIQNINEVSSTGVKFGVAIGVNNLEDELVIADYAVSKGAVLLCVDVANGYIPQHAMIGHTLKNRYTDIGLMSGNVVTYDGANYLKKSGFDFVRVGIGSGSNCSTRYVTGIGRNQLASLRDCVGVNHINLVSDGGVNEPGKAVKSFVAGANFVMLGSVIAKSLEAENDGILYGMASLNNHLANNKEIKSIEGYETKIDNSEKKPLKDILDQFLWGIRSACTYLDCNDYSDLFYKGMFVPVDESVW